jgi:HEAT repeat protein
MWLAWHKDQLPGAPSYGGKSMPVWLEELGSTDPAVGTKAVDALVGLESKGLPVLLEARKSNFIRVHRRAAQGLVQLGSGAAEPLVAALPRGGERVLMILVRTGPAAVPALEEALREGESAPYAARVLGAMGPRARPAVGALTALLLDGKAKDEARAASAEALGRIGPEEPDGPPERLAIDPVIGPLTAALSGPSAVKLAAARALAELGPAARSAVPSLARVSRDKDADVAAAACLALGATRAPAAAAPLLLRLQEADDASPAAAAGLARLGPAGRTAVGGLVGSLGSKKSDAFLSRAVLERLGPVALSGLVDSLREGNTETSRGAAEVLGLMGPRATVSLPGLTGLLQDRDPAVRLFAAQAAVRIDPERAKEIVPVLVPLVLGGEQQIATMAAAILADLGPDARTGLPVLATALQSPVERVFVRAAGVIGRMGQAAKPVAPALAAALARPHLRAHAALALASTDPGRRDEAVKALLADLEDTREPMRSLALAALARMRPPPIEALPALRALLADEQAAGPALAVLAAMDAKVLREIVPDLVGLLSSSNAGVRASATAVLARVGQDTLPALEAALKSNSAVMRGAAANALRVVQSGGPGREPSALVPLLNDAEPKVRYAAAQAIAELGCKEGVARQAMLELLGHPEAELRRAAARLPRSRRDFESWAPHLLECLYDPDAEIRRQAALSLSLEGASHDEVQQSLRGLLDDPVPAVRLAAAQRLATTGDKHLSAVLTDLARRAPPGDRAVVLRLLARVDRAAVRGLLGELEADVRSNDLHDRLDSAVTLVELDGTRAAEVLPLVIGILEGWDEPARFLAARALQQLGASARSALLALRRRHQRDDCEMVRDAIRAAIKTIE